MPRARTRLVPLRAFISRLCEVYAAFFFCFLLFWLSFFCFFLLPSRVLIFSISYPGNFHAFSGFATLVSTLYGTDAPLTVSLTNLSRKMEIFCSLDYYSLVATYPTQNVSYLVQVCDVARIYVKMCAPKCVCRCVCILSPVIIFHTKSGPRVLMMRFFFFF